MGYEEGNWSKNRQLEPISRATRVEAGSNTSTVTLRDVGSDEKGSLKSETVKSCHESQETRTRETLRWRGPAAIVNDKPVPSSERAPTSTNPQLSDSNKNLVVSPRWVLYSRQNGQLIVGRNITLTLTLTLTLKNRQVEWSCRSEWTWARKQRNSHC
jgi:hypothetical protein